MRVAGCHSRLVEEEEVHRCEAEGKTSRFQQNQCVNPILSPRHLVHLYWTTLLQHRPGAARERSGMAQSSPPHDSDAPIPLCGFAVHEPSI
jgi:hypothetical protein